MDECIKRKAVIDRLKRNLDACNPGSFSELCYRDAIETVKCFPAADVAPVVRCKDCEGGQVSDYGEYIVCCRLGLRMGFQDFCSYGEKKEEM